MRIAVSFVLAGVLLWAVPAAAVDRLVDDALVPCTADPVPIHATIGAAVTAAAAGETIVVCPGTYMEHVTVDKADLILQARGLAKLVSPGTAGSGFLVTASGVTIQAFDISGYDGVNECGVFVTGPDADVRNNRSHHNSFGICAFTSTDTRFRNNVTDANVGSGVLIQQTTGGAVLNNTTRNNGQAGISAFNCSGAPAIDHNLASGNPDDGIFVTDCDAVVRNNTVRHPGVGGNFGIRVFDSDGNVVTRNLVQGSNVGVRVQDSTNGTVSFNSIALNGVGIDLVTSDGFTLTRNNVSRSTTVDCRWDGSGAHTFLTNSCQTEIPAGAWD
jgi:parallel beta-helix repeat protein